MAERAFYIWLDGVCLDEENQAFEKEDSPFGTREAEVLAAIIEEGSTGLERAADFVVFLRRRSRDGMRILKKLEGWFLRQYDIRHASVVIQLGAMMERGERDDARTLSWHTPRLHALAMLILTAPFVAAIFAYDSAPGVFDVICSIEILAINLVAVWFLLYRFCWKRDLSFFHAAVPRIGAGIVVGYLPVLFIDEVWDLAGRSIFTVATLGVLLGLITLLYIYVEVQRRLGDTALAFARARAIYVLGSLEAFGFGMIITSLIGRIMVSRNWSPAGGGEIPVAALRESLEPLIGQLPPVIGVAPLYAFPASVLLMTFLSFFIGVFLQLMWEELPITEPL
jgi:hypothetical protein